MQPWLKAGLVGSLVLIVLTLLSTLIYLVPPDAGAVLSCCVCLPFFLVYPAIGVLAALWLTPPRTADQGAKAGALAGLVAGVIDGVFSLVWMLAIVSLGVSQRYLAQIPPAALRSLQRSGFATLFSPGGLMATVLCNAILFVLWAVACGAIGGVIYAAAKRE